MERTLLDMLSQESSVALAVSDAEGRITMTTPALRKMIGQDLALLTDDALAPLDLRAADGGVPLSADQMPLIRACAGKVVRDEVLRLSRADGLTVFLRCSAAPLRNDDGGIQGAISLVQDVTAEWTATRNQDELRDRLVATVNHELRTPLTKILGHCELLGEFAEDPAEVMSAHVRASVEAVSRAGRELAALAQRVTALADLESASRLQAASHDLTSLIAMEIESARTRCINDDQVFISLEAPSHVEVTLDDHLLGWAMRELLDNAVAHSPAGSQVQVVVEPQDGHVQISIADTGPGIPPQDRKRVLQPFERVGTPDPSQSSPGLGLTVASAVAAAHGGSLSLEDNEPHGLIVRICLLRNLDPATAPSAG